MEKTIDQVYAAVKANPNTRLRVMADSINMPPRVFATNLKRLIKQNKVTKNSATTGSLLPPTYRA